MAGIQVASLFATIGAKTDGLDKGLNQSKKSLEGFGSKMSSVAGTIAAFTASAFAAGVAMKKVYDAAKEAANLEYAKTKFDNLSKSIGTTSDVLMGDLKQATRGMVSDAELVASAGDFMALGLAKTHEEVVRLTNVAGALGMNMNQLVLTLTNQTTMRFDALGVSVDGFDEKVKALEASGLSASDAFKEAFLQQAEQQITTVGNAADSSIASFKQFEAAASNLKNELLKGLLPAIKPVVEDLTDLFEVATKDASKFALQMTLAVSAMEYFKTTGGADLGMLISDLWTAFGAPSTVEQLQEALTTYGYSFEAIGEAAAVAAPKVAFLNTIDLSAARDEYLATASVLKEELAGAYDAVRTAEENWRSGVAGQIKVELDEKKNAGELDTQGYISALETLDNYAGTQYAYEFKISESVPDLVKALLEDPAGFMSKMSGFEDAMMPLDTSVSASMQLVQDLQAELEKLERVYNGYVNIWIRKSEGTSPGSIGHGYEGVSEAPRASGGSIFGGSSYIVGERGPEVLTSNTNGQITPIESLGGNSDLLGDILLELQSQPSRIKVAIKEAFALVGG